MIYYDILYYFPNYQPQLSTMKNWKFNCGFRGFNMIPPSEITPKGQLTPPPEPTEMSLFFLGESSLMKNVVQR